MTLCSWATIGRAQLLVGRIMGWQPTAWSRGASMAHGRWWHRPILAADGVVEVQLGGGGSTSVALTWGGHSVWCRRWWLLISCRGWQEAQWHGPVDGGGKARWAEARWGTQRGGQLGLGFDWALEEDKGSSMAAHVGWNGGRVGTGGVAGAARSLR
jgi:hypothetical protein